MEFLEATVDVVFLHGCNTAIPLTRIACFQLRVVANNEEVNYKFHNKMNFKAGTTVTVRMFFQNS